MAINVTYIKDLVAKIRDKGAKDRPQTFDSINLNDLNPLEKALTHVDSAETSIVGTKSEIDLLKESYRNPAEAMEMERIILPGFKKQKDTRILKLEEIYMELSKKYPAVFNGNGYNGHKNGSKGHS